MATGSAAAKRKRRKKKKAKCLPRSKWRKLPAKKRRKTKVCKPKPKPKAPVVVVNTPTGTHPATTLPVVPVAGEPGPSPDPPAPPGGPVDSPIPMYTGPWGAAQAERLLWRAGFGPRPGQVAEFAGLGMEEAVVRLTRPSGSPVMTGDEPTVDGAPLDAYNTWYGDFLFWFDRMVRSSHQLVERLALVFHDWWATSNAAVGSNRLMLAQTDLFRVHGLGSFRDMVVAVTQDPAMLLFLNGTSNRKGAINENYGRELMELFTLGADRGAYTEDDVREMGRALSGWRSDWSSSLGHHNFRFDPTRWDAGNKTIFGQTGAFNWQDACRLVVDHPLHRSFFVAKLWSYFVPVPPGAEVARALEEHYVASGHQIRPIVEAILCSKEFNEGPAMVKPPVVHLAGMARARERSIKEYHWTWLSEGAGQRLYEPPDVAGWDDAHWLDTSTMRGRWECVNYALSGQTISPSTNAYPAESGAEAVSTALSFWLNPTLRPETRDALNAWAEAAIPATASSSLRAQRQNALRQLIGASPDYMTC